MVSPLKNNSVLQAFVVLTLGLMPLTTPQAFLTPVLAQSDVAQTRAAITTENDRIFVHSLIKSSLLSLNQANQTQDYSVLRKLGSPGFQMKNTEQDLSRIFRSTREANLDFTAVTEYEPTFTSQPMLDEDNNLLVTGYFPTQPQINFELAYQLINGTFRIDTLTIGIGAQ
ncbi:hypothetical protein [Synechococcus sp. BDU 130192]|uniref:hypothetical protein n=1 Tax=Synechococcus sp. BDU 130192 TaxID=2042059 RepID=UPI001180448B|nr:hypothetical protein [Synechococcus sp. BDU 130192]